MAEFVTGFQTADGVKKYDYNALGNQPSTSAGTVVSPNADYAEVAEWADGNPNAEDRTGFFVCLDVPVDGLIMRKATSIDDVKGVTMLAPAFAGNYNKTKVDSTGKLLPKYSYVGIMGLVPVIDNGTCTVGGRCMPDDNGCAVPSSNDMGYQVVNRVDVNHVLIIVEPNADMLQRIKTQMVELQENGGGGGVSSWNDLTDKPFSKETKGADIAALAETSVDFTSGAKAISGFAENSFIEGNKYIVNWNGTKYETRCYVEDGSYILGNGKLANMATETTDPFCIVSWGGVNCLVYKGTEDAETITIKVDGVQETTYHHLDPRYIPNMYYEEEVELLPETECTFAYNEYYGVNTAVIESDILFEYEKEYIFIYNGKEYRCSSSSSGDFVFGNIGALADGDDTGEPFVIVATDGMMLVFPLEEITKAAISIIRVDNITVPPKFVPEFDYIDISNQNGFVWTDPIRRNIAIPNIYKFIMNAHKRGGRINMGVSYDDHNSTQNVVFNITPNRKPGDGEDIYYFDVIKDGYMFLFEVYAYDTLRLSACYGLTRP